MKYYLSLSINQRINFKGLFMTMQPFCLLFIVCPLNEAIEAVCQKLEHDNILTNNTTPNA